MQIKNLIKNQKKDIVFELIAFNIDQFNTKSNFYLSSETEYKTYVKSKNWTCSNIYDPTKSYTINVLNNKWRAVAAGGSYSQLRPFIEAVKIDMKTVR